MRPSCDPVEVGVIAELRTESGERVSDLVDPAGGAFEYAAGFDRVLLEHNDASFSLLRYVDPYGDAVFNRVQMPDLLADIDQLLARDLLGDERRGLERLRVLAERCSAEVHLYLWFVGD